MSMTDKVQKIREEVERLINQKDENKYLGIVLILELKKVLSFIDSLQENPVCAFSTNRYTDEDRKVLCDGCEEECKYSESDDFTKALAECISQAQCNVVDPMVHAETWKDELIKLSKCEEPVSKELVEAASRYAKEEYNNVYPLPSQDDIDKWLFKEFGIIAGACSSVKEFEYNVARRVVEKAMEYAKEQMLKDAVEAAVTDIRTYKEENEVDFTIMLKKGIIPYELEQEVKLIIVKEG